MITSTRQSGPAILKSSVVVVALALLCFVGNRAFSGRPVLDPDKIAAAEAHMWQAYYARDLPRLYSEMATLLRAQFKLSSADV